MVSAPKVLVRISAPNTGRAVFHVEGTEPLMTAKFSSRIKRQLIAEREAGAKPATRGKKTHDPADYAARGLEGAYRSAEGWYGIHAAAIRNAAISACRLVGFKMTLARLSIFVEADGYDVEEGTPLIRLDAPEPEISIMAVRNATGVMDLRARPIWRPGWRMAITMRWDQDQFGLSDITNLLARVGLQVGIGEARPDSRESAGLGYGLFRLIGDVEVDGGVQ